MSAIAKLVGVFSELFEEIELKLDIAVVAGFAPDIDAGTSLCIGVFIFKFIIFVSFFKIA